MKLRPFELGLVVVFLGLIFVSLFVFSTFSGGSSEEEFSVGNVLIWGMLDARSMNELINELKDENDGYLGVTYQYISPETFSDRLVNALADGVGPDVILISHEQLVEYRRRIAAYQYEIRDIRNAYIDGAEIFALNDGLYAYPIAVDPLVLYWNRDNLSNKGLLNAPRTWEELINVQFPELIERDYNRNIENSVVAMGEYENIRNAFGIFSMLLLQSGTRGVVEQDRGYAVQLDQSINGSNKPLYSTLSFYTRFSQVNNSLYSWNRSFIEDRSRFISENLSFYFGYGSEGVELERLNPNLNFDIAEVPQSETATVRRTYGKFYGLAVTQASQNKVGASAMVSILSGRENAARIAAANNMVPAYRDYVAAGSSDTYGNIAYKVAPVAYGWLNPGMESVDEIFTTMTKDVNENRYDVSTAVLDVVERLEDQYRN